LKNCNCSFTVLFIWNTTICHQNKSIWWANCPCLLFARFPVHYSSPRDGKWPFSFRVKLLHLQLY